MHLAVYQAFTFWNEFKLENNHVNHSLHYKGALSLTAPCSFVYVNRYLGVTVQALSYALPIIGQIPTNICCDFLKN